MGKELEEGPTRVKEGSAAHASLAWTSEEGMLHCSFNMEQLSEKMEAQQRFERWFDGGGVEGAAYNFFFFFLGGRKCDKVA